MEDGNSLKTGAGSPTPPQSSGTTQKLSGKALAMAFEDLTLDASTFDHEQHLTLAWYYLEEHPLPEAIIRFRDGLIRLTNHLGASGKYHETITFAIMMCLHERRICSGIGDFMEFKKQHPELFDGWRKLLNRYYSKELLESSAARFSFFLPDRIRSGDE